MNRQYLIKRIGSAPPPLRKIVEDQDAYDIIDRIKVKHKSCAVDYDKIATDFEGGTVYDIAEKLWTFCKNNLKYHRETVNSQYVSSPQTMLSRGYCDCKGYALFIGGILDALNRLGYNINWKYRFASDDLFNEVPGHVFIVINDRGQEIWVDPVLDEFNQDYYFPYHTDKKVSVSGVAILRGVGCCAIGYLDIGAVPSPNGLFGAVPSPPAGSRLVTTINGWPDGLPTLVKTPDNRIQFSFLPMKRPVTINDLGYIMTALQAIYNSYLPNSYDIFTYVSEGGKMFAPEIKKILENFQYDVRPGINGIFYNANNIYDLLSMPDSFKADKAPAKDFLFDTVAPIFSYIGYLIPVVGQVAAFAISTVKASDAAKDKAYAQQSAAIYQQVAQQGDQNAGSFIDGKGNLSTGGGTDNRMKILLIAAAAVAAILLIK